MTSSRVPECRVTVVQRLRCTLSQMVNCLTVTNPPATKELLIGHFRKLGSNRGARFDGMSENK